METVLTALATLCVVANAAIAVADLIPARFVLQNSAAVGVPRGSLPLLAALKGSGAVGVAAGLVWLPGLGLAAAIGLTLFYVGAVTAHIRAGVFRTLGFPLTYLLLAAATGVRFLSS